MLGTMTYSDCASCSAVIDIMVSWGTTAYCVGFPGTSKMFWVAAGSQAQFSVVVQSFVSHPWRCCM